MSMSKRTAGARAVLVLALLAAAALIPGIASADDSGNNNNDLNAARSGFTFGGRASYYRPKGADSGSLYGGAQLRLHMTSVLAVEGSADYQQNKYGGTVVDVYPVQASLMIYLAPSWIVSPYILGGAGWYHTSIRNGPTSDRYGPHAGAGLEAALSRHWSIDASYRYLWTQSLTAPTTASPAGRNFSDNGFMLTTALNYRF